MWIPRLVIAALVLTNPAMAEAGAQRVTIGCPVAPLRTGDAFVSGITIDMGAGAVGAYALAITYDPAVVRIAAVAGGSTAEFTSPPVANSADFPTGRTRVVAFNSTSLVSPTGVASVAQVSFNVVGTPGSSTPLALEIVTLTDTDGARIAADTLGCNLEVAGTIPTHSATPSATVPTATPMRSATPSVIGTPHACTGDCNADGEVTVDELVRAVNRALGHQTVEQCSGSDVDTLAEVITAVDRALSGCRAQALPDSPPWTEAPTASATLSPVATPAPTQPSRAHQPPVVGAIGVYRTFPTLEVRFPRRWRDHRRKIAPSTDLRCAR